MNIVNSKVVCLLLFLVLNGCTGTGGSFSSGNEGNTPEPYQPWPELDLPENIIYRYGCAFIPNPNVPTEEEIRSMATYRSVIIDVELCNHKFIRRFKELNPNILVGIYINPQDIFIDYYDTRPGQMSIRDYLLTNYDNPETGESFFVYDIEHVNKQSYFIEWPMYLMNLSTNCPRIGGLNYSEYVLNLIVTYVFETNPYADQIDFISFDNAIRDYAWMSYFDHVSSLDANWNGINDLEEQTDDPFTSPINVAWRDGINYIVSGIKDASSVMIIGNQPNDYYPLMSGKQFEGIGQRLPGPAGFNFGDLTNNPADVLTIVEDFMLPNNFTYNIIQASRYDKPSLELSETAIVIAMLNGNNVVAFQFDTFWRPEVALIEPGDAIDSSYTKGVFRVREFQNCWIVFNTYEIALDINLNGTNTLIPAYSGKIIEK